MILLLIHLSCSTAARRAAGPAMRVRVVWCVESVLCARSAFAPFPRTFVHAGSRPSDVWQHIDVLTTPHLSGPELSLLLDALNGSG